MDLKVLHAELSALRDRAKSACDRISEMISERHRISAASRTALAISMFIREEARQVQQQVRLSVAWSKERRGTPQRLGVYSGDLFADGNG